jgi:hypothetical protein
MSSTAEPGEINLREQLVRIDRAIAETRKFQEESDKFAAEQRKLAAEATKLAGEQVKFAAEAAKLTWDRKLAPWALFAAVIGGAVVAVINHLWK